MGDSGTGDRAVTDSGTLRCVGIGTTNCSAMESWMLKGRNTMSEIVVDFCLLTSGPSKSQESMLIVLLKRMTFGGLCCGLAICCSEHHLTWVSTLMNGYAFINYFWKYMGFRW